MSWRYLVPGVNDVGKFGRWFFAEFTSIYEIAREFGELIHKLLNRAAK